MDLQLEYLAGWNLVNKRFQNENDSPIEWNVKGVDEPDLYPEETATPKDFSETLRSATFDGKRFAVEIPHVPDGNGGFVPVKVGIVPIEDLDLLSEIE